MDLSSNTYIYYTTFKLLLMQKHKAIIVNIFTLIEGAQAHNMLFIHHDTRGAWFVVDEKILPRSLPNKAIDFTVERHSFLKVLYIFYLVAKVVYWYNRRQSLPCRLYIIYMYISKIIWKSMQREEFFRALLKQLTIKIKHNLSGKLFQSLLLFTIFML
jgi:hypothetical protein